jgi:DNA-binding phage protein
MSKTITSRYDVAEHLRTPEEVTAYLEACLEEADGDVAFVAKAQAAAIDALLKLRREQCPASDEEIAQARRAGRP